MMIDILHDVSLSLVAHFWLTWESSLLLVEMIVSWCINLNWLGFGLKSNYQRVYLGYNNVKRFDKFANVESR